MIQSFIFVFLFFNLKISDLSVHCMQVETAVRPLLDAYFPQLSGVQVLAQPGSFYVASAFSLAVNIMGKKVVTHHWDSLAQGELLYSLRL